MFPVCLGEIIIPFCSALVKNLNQGVSGHLSNTQTFSKPCLTQGKWTIKLSWVWGIEKKQLFGLFCIKNEIFILKTVAVLCPNFAVKS